MELVKKITSYLKEAVGEMKKVVWPTKKQTINYSLIVIALSLATALFFGVLDYVFNLGLKTIIDDNNQAVTAETDFETSGVETPPAYSTKSAE